MFSPTGTKAIFLSSSFVCDDTSSLHITNRQLCSLVAETTSTLQVSGKFCSRESASAWKGTVPIKAAVESVPLKLSGISSGVHCFRLSYRISICDISFAASSIILLFRIISPAEFIIFSSCIASRPKACFSTSVLPLNISENPVFSGA